MKNDACFPQEMLLEPPRLTGDWLSSFTHVTTKELKTIKKVFKDGKAPRVDNVPISIIKKALDLISDPLLSIINLSLSLGVFSR